MSTLPLGLFELWNENVYERHYRIKAFCVFNTLGQLEVLWWIVSLLMFVSTGWHWFHGIQWKPAGTVLFALYQPNGQQWISVRHMGCRPDHPRLRHVSIRVINKTQKKSAEITPSCSHFMSTLYVHRDKMFPALGFGAQLQPDWKVRKSVTVCASA